MLKRLRNQKGFTLIELVFAVIILAILAGTALLNMGSTENDAKHARVQADLQSLATAIKVYHVKTGEFPGDLNALTSVNGAYEPMLSEIPDDPFDPSIDPDAGYSYVIDSSNEFVTISSENGMSKIVR